MICVAGARQIGLVNEVTHNRGAIGQFSILVSSLCRRFVAGPSSDK